MICRRTGGKLTSLLSFFSIVLLTHHLLRTPAKILKTGTKATIPAWQVSISAVIVEMSSYQGLDGTDEDATDDGEQREKEKDLDDEGERTSINHEGENGEE